jgi:hypothetical protein
MCGLATALSTPFSTQLCALEWNQQISVFDWFGYSPLDPVFNLVFNLAAAMGDARGDAQSGPACSTEPMPVDVLIQEIMF